MNREKIAIIGSGISGLTCALLLADKYHVDLFDANDYLGGHANTYVVEEDNASIAIDTGFIVYNDATYPLFNKLLRHLGISGIKSEMSFSFHVPDNSFEYKGHSLLSLFSKRRNIINPAFYKMLYDIVRFNKTAKKSLKNATIPPQQTLAQFCSEHHFGELFYQCYLLPMIASIWSANPRDIKNYPLTFVLNFFNNHGFLNIYDRPQWYTVKGGSRAYVSAIAKRFTGNIYLQRPVKKVLRSGQQALVITEEEKQLYDKVIFACHSDQALAMLNNPLQLEASTLQAIKYQPNEVSLHTDKSVMPLSKRTWASWNYQQHHQAYPKLTYYMNSLQSLHSPQDYFVSVNCREDIDTEKCIFSTQYHHPILTESAIAAQKYYKEINSLGTIFYCGAYWFNGFHEDGVKSAAGICKQLGVDFV